VTEEGFFFSKGEKGRGRKRARGLCLSIEWGRKIFLTHAIDFDNIFSTHARACLPPSLRPSPSLPLSLSLSPSLWKAHIHVSTYSLPPPVNSNAIMSCACNATKRGAWHKGFAIFSCFLHEGMDRCCRSLALLQSRSVPSSSANGSPSQIYRQVAFTI